MKKYFVILPGILTFKFINKKNLNKDTPWQMSDYDGIPLSLLPQFECATLEEAYIQAEKLALERKSEVWDLIDRLFLYEPDQMESDMDADYIKSFYPKDFILVECHMCILNPF